MQEEIVKVAVSSATYRIDKPYSYLVPDELKEKLQPGCRVFVPFSHGNRISEGIVLSGPQPIAEEPGYKLKSVIRAIDESPVLNHERLQLALFMRERFFCTVYDAVRAILPAGLWLDSSGKRRVNDKSIEIASLIISSTEALDVETELRDKNAPQQANLLAELATFGQLPVNELLQFTGASRNSLKALMKAEYVELFRREVFRRPKFTEGEKRELPTLNKEQMEVFESIREKLVGEKASVSLLQGITGSGKTAVYIRLIAEALNKGKSAVLLVPEIALTPQMLQTFSSFFGDEIAVQHSGLSPAERYDEWKRIKSGNARVVIGTRSAVFSPVVNPGIFIIDEEQEESYRSEISPRYNARDIAVFRCFKNSCPLLLGSATPDLCSRYYAESGRYSYYRLDRRYNEMDLPEVSIIDMKAELRSGNIGNISTYLRDELQKNIEKGEQSILFLNRRGAHKLLTCGSCGFVYTCPNCSVSLTYHSVGDKLMCHYCGYSAKPDTGCPDCGAQMKYIGAGTQLIEEELNTLLPNAGIIRMDTDVLNSGITHESVFEKFRDENIPIMIGTQMVTKGLNFENVTLVGVISADQSLYSGDYRAAEKTFSLITQVVGRSGRGEKKGRAVIQTFSPENDVILQAARQDYDAFYESEISMRRILNSPPFTRLLSITVSGISEATVYDACRFVRRRMEFLLKDYNPVQVLGPVPMTVVKLNNRFRYRINIKCPENKSIRELVSAVICECSADKRFRGLSFYAENDASD